MTMWAKEYALQNSSLFDAVLRVLTACCTNSNKMKQLAIKNSVDESAWKTVSSLLLFGNSAITQARRLEFFLNHIIANKEIENKHSNRNMLNAKSDVSDMIRHMIGVNYVNSRQFVTCVNCGKVNRIELENILEIIVSEHGIDDLSQLILERYPDIYMCTTDGCTRRLTPEEPMSRGPLIFVTLTNNLITSLIERTTPESPVNICLREIPRNITVNGQSFKLQGCVSYVIDRNHWKFYKTGHYVAFCTDDTTRWEMFDGLNKSSEVVSQNTYPIKTLVYYGGLLLEDIINDSKYLPITE